MFKNKFAKRSIQTELLDDLTLSGEELERNLDEMAKLSFIFGSNHLLLRALTIVYKKYKEYFHNHEVVIGDLGCGGGDMLIAINKWAAKRKLNVKMIGVDISHAIINYAKKKTKQYKNISYKELNFLDKAFKEMKFDVVCMSHVCHHLDNAEMIKLFKQLKQQTNLAIIINDLERHWGAYYFIKIFTKIFRYSYLTQNDAPISVMRGFKKEDFLDILKQADVNQYDLQQLSPYRWQLIIWCRS